MFQRILKLNLIILLSVLFFASCQKEDLGTPDTPPVVVNPTTPNNNNSTPIQSLILSDSAGCYFMVFPITFINEDSTTSTANAEEDLEDIFLNPPYPVDVAYPIYLEDPITNQTATANDETELAALLANCDPLINDPNQNWCDSTNVNFGFLGCYDMAYPVSFVLEDGTIATAQGDDDLQNIFTSNNPPVDFSYPLNLVSLIDGTTQIANSADELGILLAACDGFTIDPTICDTLNANCNFDLNFGFGFVGCYDLVYPASLVLEDGSIVTVQSAEDFANLFLDNNLPVDFSYPINLVSLIDSTSHTANSVEELDALIMACGGFGGGNWNANAVIGLTFISITPDGFQFPVCYSYNYPITVNLEGGATSTATNDDEMMNIVFNNVVSDFEYPIQVTDNSTGTTLIANNADEVGSLIDDCQ